MRHVPLCLVVPFVLACSTGPSEQTIAIRVQGTVTAADDGSPVAGAVLEVREACIGDCTTRSKPLTFSLNATPPKAGLPVASPK